MAGRLVPQSGADLPAKKGSQIQPLNSVPSLTEIKPEFVHRAWPTAPAGLPASGWDSHRLSSPGSSFSEARGFGHVSRHTGLQDPCLPLLKSGSPWACAVRLRQFSWPSYCPLSADKPSNTVSCHLPDSERLEKMYTGRLACRGRGTQHL